MNEIFEVYISRPGETGASTGTSIRMPATPCEILDRLERARITDSETIYNTEMIGCELEYLTRFISQNVSIYELNLLAQNLSVLGEWEHKCFEGMVTMAGESSGNSPIPIEKLINLTYSTGTCQIAAGVYDDKSLGEFYVANDFPVVPQNLPEELYDLLDYEFIGRKMRMSEGGVFTSSGYVVQSGEIESVYDSPNSDFLEIPDYMVLLKVCRHGNEQASFLKLPAAEGDFKQAIEVTGALSEKECMFTAEDCRFPWLAEKLSNALEADPREGFTKAEELARQLSILCRKGELILYKAMLEGAPYDLELEEAIDLSYHTASFSLSREITSPADYAKQVLSRHNIEMAEELFACTNLYLYGEKLMEELGMEMTEYGAVCPVNGHTVEQLLNRPEQSQGMEFCLEM